MKNVQLDITKISECKDGENGYKILEWTVSDPAEELYTIVTPIKKQ
ncbi:hypothetical protein [Bacillus rubiinfantis]|nr:hypothetical protein [Bacillus rubiinfantis]